MYQIILQKEDKTVIERSRFYSFSFKCTSLKQQSEILKKIKSQNPSATHVCYASVIFQDSQLLFYSNDDQEPSGTAGAQILSALKEGDFVNTLCVVVRYFGGVKLGVPNLGRAYKDSAKNVLDDNKREVELKDKYQIFCDYNSFSHVKSLLNKKNVETLSMQYDSEVCFEAFLSEVQFRDVEKYTKKAIKLNQREYC